MVSYGFPMVPQEFLMDHHVVVRPQVVSEMRRCTPGGQGRGAPSDVGLQPEPLLQLGQMLGASDVMFWGLFRVSQPSNSGIYPTSRNADKCDRFQKMMKSDRFFAGWW